MGAVESHDRLTNFHNDYVRLLEARAAGDEARAMQIQMDIAHYSAAVHRDLDGLGMAYWTLMDAPALGGRRWPTPVVDVVLTRLGDEYNIPPTEVLMVIRRAIGEYERRAQEPRLQDLILKVGAVLRFPWTVLRVAYSLFTANLFATAAIVSIVAGVLAILQALGKLF